MRKKSDLLFEEAFSDELFRPEAEHVELPAPRPTFLAVLGVAVGIALIVIAKASYLSLAFGDFYKARAAANATEEIELSAFRAVITDRFGEPLAKNVSSFSVYLNVPAFLGDPEAASALKRELGQILDLNEDDVSGLVQGVDLEEKKWIVLARGVTAEEAIAIQGLNNDAVEVLGDYERLYSDAPAFAHVVGYTGAGEGNTIVGKSGVEFAYDKILAGSPGRSLVFRDALGEVLDRRVVSEPTAGQTLELTIDASLQRYFYERLRGALAALGREAGAGIALNPKNGEVLALVSFPSFDSNIFVERSRSAERPAILNKRSKPLFNRAVSGLYSPGSTIKPLVALSALRDSVAEPDTKIFSAGSLEIPNPYYPETPSVFLDWKPHGWVDVKSALARSSNIYFYLLGGGLPADAVGASDMVQGSYARKGLGIERLNSYWKTFLLGEKTGIDLPFEAQGFLPDASEKEARTGDRWRLGDTYNVSIGQGDLLITPIDLLNFIASVGNGGRIYRPFIKKGASPSVLFDYSLWSEELKYVREGLRDAVLKPYGSSHLLHDLPVAVAGKTGTPQVANKEKTNAFFAGYAPADDPEIAILVLIENAKEGSLNALPVAKDVFRWYYENRLSAR